MTRRRRQTPTKVVKTDGEWRLALSPEQYRVMRMKRTERAFTGKYVHADNDGVYRCAGCAAALFDSNAKFDSGTGWPSFTEPAVADAVALKRDVGFGMIRTEVTCHRCGGHLGHVFRDGPGPDGRRYCIDSCALDLDAGRTGTPAPSPYTPIAGEVAERSEPPT